MVTVAEINGHPYRSNNGIHPAMATPQQIPIGRMVSIHECGLDEYWLQDQIAGNPSCLGLGDLELLFRERAQSSGGRLDIQMKDPSDDSMYEVEVMLGDTDETHIIRAIEYWLREKKRFPQRQHYPVLVAEGITRRFFDVIQSLSESIPIIAIQASIVESHGSRVLTFTTILDLYEEREDTEPGGFEAHDEAYWQGKSPWTNDAAKELLAAVAVALPGAKLNYVKNYIALMVNGNIYLSLHKRSSDKSLLQCWVGEKVVNAATSLLDSEGISYTVRKNRTLRMTVDQQSIAQHAALFKQLAEMISQAWSN
jgi:hypothetical protein